MTTSSFTARTVDKKVIRIEIKNQKISDIFFLLDQNIDSNSLPWVTSGLFDLQVNGALGISFNNPNATMSDYSKVIQHLILNGMTGILATLITTDRNSFSNSLALLEKTRKAIPLIEKVVEGYHMEGPAISPKDGYRGAHPIEHVRIPSSSEYKEWLAASNNRIRLVTVAPEIPGVLEWIQQLVSDGITVAIGHTSASSRQINDAVMAGAKISTHLGNGCESSIHRHENPIWPQLSNDCLAASLITDGHHLPEPFLRTVLKVKKPGKLVLTCDASPLAGLPAGEYYLWNKTLNVDSDGRVLVPNTPYLAGSGHFLGRCLQIALKLNEWDEVEVVKAASQVPRMLLGLDPHFFDIGSPADFILWQGPSFARSTIQKVCVSGEWYHSGMNYKL
jgi:N-acetylglucosamine-6-phosphate deacetylase